MQLTYSEYRFKAWLAAGAKPRTGIQGMRSGSVFFPVAMVSNVDETHAPELVSTLVGEMIREPTRWPIQEI